MSFDLAVLHEPSGITAEEASNKYDRLGDSAAAVAKSSLHPQIKAFYLQLTMRFPELDDVADEDVDRSPWSAGLFVTETAVSMCITWSQAEEVAPFVRNLADQHGLVLYDPQQDVVQHPASMRNATSLVLTSCDGSQQDDPDRARIRRVLQGLSRANWFAILERDLSYIQVGYGAQAATRPDWYALERREGSADHHFGTEVSDLDEVIAAFIGFAENEDGWHRRSVWQNVKF